MLCFQFCLHFPLTDKWKCSLFICVRFILSIIACGLLSDVSSCSWGGLLSDVSSCSRGGVISDVSSCSWGGLLSDVSSCSWGGLLSDV